MRILLLLAALQLSVRALALDPAPPEAIRSLKEAFQREHPPAFRFDLAEVPQARRAAELVRPDTALPQTHRFPYDAIRALHAYAASCAPGDRAGAAAPALRKALEWQRFLCGESSLSRDFFERAPFMHPSGKSFALLALSSGKEEFTAPGWLARHLDRFHVAELLHPRVKNLASAEQTMLAGMSRAQLEALVDGAPLAWSDRYVLFADRDGPFDTASKYFVYPRLAWETLLQRSRFAVTEARPDSFCLQREGNACWTYGKHVGETRGYLALAIASSALALVFCVVLFVAKLVDRRRQAKARLFVLQTLTHELRTPAAALTLGLENLRRDFDALPPGAQSEVLRLCDETQRLKRLVSASGRYLQSHPVRFDFARLPSVNEYLEGVLDGFRDRGVTLVPLAEDRPLRTDPYWLSLCVSNLVDNALRHGSTPVTVHVRMKRGRLHIAVSDAGEWRDGASDAAGLGLGLGIVRNVVRGLEGKLRFRASPTTFSIILRGNP